MKLFIWSLVITMVIMAMWKIIIPWWRMRIIFKRTRKVLEKIQRENPDITDDVNIKEGIRLIDKALKEDKL